MLTEHPILSDDGQKTGTQTPTADGKQGRVASIITMGSVSTEALPADPKLRALYVERRDLERRIEGLKLLKDSMDAGEVCERARAACHGARAEDAADSRKRR